MPPQLSPEKSFGVLKIIRFAMLIAAPPIYLAIASVVNVDEIATPETDLFLLYMILAVAVAQPAIGFLIARYRLTGINRESMTASSGSALFMSISIVKMALVEAVYLYGFVVFLLSADMTNMLYFYPVGIAWTAVVWPSRRAHDEFIREFEGI